MARIQAYLDATTRDLLAHYAEQNGCSLSHAAGNIITACLAGEAIESKNRLESKQQFLRLMNVLNQVLMCVYDEKKVTVKSTSAKECLEKIKKSVLQIMED